MTSYMEQFQFLYVGKTDDEYQSDKIVSKKVMIHLQSFFKKDTTDNGYRSKTRVQNKIYKNKTLKHK